MYMYVKIFPDFKCILVVIQSRLKLHIRSSLSRLFFGMDPDPELSPIATFCIQIPKIPTIPILPTQPSFVLNTPKHSSTKPSDFRISQGTLQNPLITMDDSQKRRQPILSHLSNKHHPSPSHNGICFSLCNACSPPSVMFFPPTPLRGSVFCRCGRTRLRRSFLNQGGSGSLVAQDCFG